LIINSTQWYSENEHVNCIDNKLYMLIFRISLGGVCDQYSLHVHFQNIIGWSLWSIQFTCSFSEYHWVEFVINTVYMFIFRISLGGVYDQYNLYVHFQYIIGWSFWSIQFTISFSELMMFWKWTCKLYWSQTPTNDILKMNM
jgi:hypothetical protein